jgi:hypothetical protein
LTLEAFVGAFAGWVTEYNRRAHSELAGQSPIDAFTADPTPLRPVSVEEARALLAARKDAKVRRFGIQHQKHNYVHPELHELVGEIVEIAFAPHDQRSVEVYWRGDWVCTAAPQETLTAEEQGEVIHARKAYAKELRARQRKAVRAARTRIAPLTATDPEPVETTSLSERDADVTRAGPAPAARTDLLIRPGTSEDPLFITLGRRRRDGTYTHVGGRCHQEVLADILKRLGAAAELPRELRHPHALRHTCATELLRAGANVSDVRTFLGHASVKTTSVYLASGDDRQEHVVALRQRGRPTLDEDREAPVGGL